MDLAEFTRMSNTRIDNANKQRALWETRLTDIKTAVEDVLKKSLENILKNESKINGIKNANEYIKLLPEYKVLKKDNGNKDMNFVVFCEKIKEKDIGLYCDIIGRFTAVERMNKGTNSLDKKLEDAYELKNSKKTILAKRAEEIVALYNEVLKENEKEINNFTKKIEEDEKLKIEKENKRNETANKYKSKGDLTKEEQRNKEEELKKLDAEIKRIEDRITENKTQLSDIKIKNEEYSLSIRTAINEFKDYAKENAQIDIGNYNAEPAKSADTGTKVVQSSPKNAIRTTIRTKDSDKEIAKKMLLDIRNMDNSQRITLINQYGYEDLYEMTKNLGPLGRKELKSMLTELLKVEDAEPLKVKDIKICGIEVKNGKIEDKDIKTLEAKIQEFMRDIDSKTYTEIRNFEEDIEQLNIVTLIRATSTGKIHKFFDRFTRNGVNFNNLNLALKKFSNMRYERKTAELNNINTLRSKIHVKEQEDLRPRTYVDKNKKSPIRTDRSNTR